MDMAPVSLIQDAGTCWKSEHGMMCRLLKLKEAATLELLTSDKGVENLTSSEWKGASGMMTVLQPIAEEIREHSEKYNTLSCVTPFSHGCEAVETFFSVPVMPSTFGGPSAKRFFLSLQRNT